MALRQLILPPRERDNAGIERAFAAQVRIGLRALGVIGTLLPLSGLLSAHLLHGVSTHARLVTRLPWSGPATLAGVALSLLGLVLSWTAIGARHGRLYTALVLVGAAVLLGRVEHAAGLPGIFSQAPPIVVITLLCMPFRPLQALALLAATAAAYLLSAVFLAPGGMQPSLLLSTTVHFAVFGAVALLISGGFYALRLRYAQAQVERAAARDQLAAEERKYRSLFERSSDGIYTVDAASNKILMVNPAFERMVGLSSDEIVGRDFHTFVEPAETLRMSNEEIRGSRALLKLSPPGSAGHMIAEAHSAFGEDVAVGSMRDITARVEAERKLRETVEELEQTNRTLRETQAQLVQSEKMASLGNLVAGVAHEINTPLGSIHSNADISRRALDRLRAALEQAAAADPKGVQRPLEALCSANDVTLLATTRIVEIVRSLRNFARLDEAEKKQVDIHEGIESTLTLLHHELKQRVDVVRDYGELPEIECYPNQLNQVLMNLLTNALQAIEGPGTITIRTRCAGERVEVAISDTGSGISEEARQRIFDPGFTTKGVGVGTGLGLSIAYRIVQKHAGELRVESEVGAGSTFTVSLPLRL